MNYNNFSFCLVEIKEEEKSAPKPRRKFVMTESSYRHMVEIIGQYIMYIIQSNNSIKLRVPCEIRDNSVGYMPKT